MSLFDLPYWLMSAFVFVLGAITGSFLNVCIYRIPAEPLLWPALRGLWQPPSRCPRCRTQIGWRDNVPILSWLLLRGRCRTCRMWISARYPLVELLNACLFLALYWLEIPSGWPPQEANGSLFSEIGPQTVPGWWPLSATTGLHLRYIYHLVLIESLIVASFIDIDRREIPDASTLPAMAIGLLGGLLIGRVHIVPAWSQNPFQVFTLTRLTWPDWRVDQWPAVPLWFGQHPHWHGLLVSVAGLVIAGGLTWAVRWIGFVALRREAMGFGDVILMAVIGSFLGWQPAVLAFIIAPAVALVFLPVQLFVHRDRYIPYGPYLSMGALMVLAAWQPLWNGFGGWGGAAAIFDLGPILILLFAVMAVMFFLTLLLVQGLKRLFGLHDHPEEFLVQWTAADQSQFQAGERVDTQTGLWRLPIWPGQASGRGVLQEDRWRRPQTLVSRPHRMIPPPGQNGG